MKNKIGITILIAAFIAMALITSFAFYRQDKSAYIQLGKVYGDFEMTKQYSKKLTTVQMARKDVIDSLELGLRSQSRLLQSSQAKQGDLMDKFLLEKEYYDEKKKQFDEDNGAMQRQYTEEITKQLNQYIKDYGEKHQYDFIYGAEGSGVIMYGKEKLNVTTDVIKYINERYNGTSK